LCAPAELPSKEVLNLILDDVIQLESNEDVQEKALILAEKLNAMNNAYQAQFEQLTQIVNEFRARNQIKNSLDVSDLVQIIQSAKIHSDCYNEEVAKECY
jgi:hypothetical protein